MNVQNLQRAKELSVQIQPINKELQELATPFEVGLIFELLDFESKEIHSPEEIERYAIVSEFLTEERYPSRISRPTGDIQPLPPKTVEESNAIATQWAKELVSGVPQSLEDKYMGGMVAYLLGVPNGKNPTGLSFEIADGYKSMQKKLAKSQKLEKIKADVIARAVDRFNRPVWYKRLWAWLTGSKALNEANRLDKEIHGLMSKMYGEDWENR